MRQGYSEEGGYRCEKKNEEGQNTVRWSESDRHFFIPIHNPPLTFRRATHYAQVRTHLRGNNDYLVAATPHWATNPNHCEFFHKVWPKLTRGAPSSGFVFEIEIVLPAFALGLRLNSRTKMRARQQQNLRQ